MGKFVDFIVSIPYNTLRILCLRHGTFPYIHKNLRKKTSPYIRFCHFGGTPIRYPNNGC